MKKRRLIISNCFSIIIGVIRINAQESVSTSGGVIYGNGGNISYTIGQLVYTTNLSAYGSIAQGVQQPLEISVTTASELICTPTTGCTIFPNPTNDRVTLTVNGKNTDSFSCKLISLEGKLLESKTDIKHKSDLSLSKYQGSIFVLKVLVNGTLLHTFKIIKIL